jgi:hypothetical protein
MLAIDHVIHQVEFVRCLHLAQVVPMLLERAQFATLLLCTGDTAFEGPIDPVGDECLVVSSPRSATLPILDGLQQSDVALLNEIQELDICILVTCGDT